MRLERTASVLLAILLVVGSACSDDTRDAVEDDVRTAITGAADLADEASEDAVELATRNFASTQAGQEFESAGHPIDGDLTCEADATTDLTAVDVTCTGTTVDGDVASLTGTTSEFPGASFNELKGTFIGTVGGSEVFTVDRLGD